MKKLTWKKLAILEELRKDSKQKLLDISKKLRIPVSTVFNNYYELRDYLNMNHTLSIDFEKAGYPLRKLLFLKPKNYSKTKTFLEKNFHTNNLWRLENNKLLVDCLFSNFSELEDFKLFLEQDSKIYNSNDLLKILKFEEFKPKI